MSDTDQTSRRIAWCERVVAECEKVLAEASSKNPEAWTRDENGESIVWVPVRRVYGDGEVLAAIHCEVQSNARLIVAAAAAFPQWLADRKSDVETARMTCRKGDERFVGLVVERLQPVAAALGIEPPEGKP